MRRQQKTILAIVMAFLAVILLGQLWLLVGVLEAYMGEDAHVGFPAALASGLCFLTSIWLLRFVR
jgi:hypothetical protein